MTEYGYTRDKSETPILPIEADDPFRKQELKPLNHRQVTQAMRLVNARHPLRKTPLWQALPYTAPLERFLPESCVRWINGESQNRGDSNQVEEADDKLEVSETDRRRAMDAAELSGEFNPLTAVDFESLI